MHHLKQQTTAYWLGILEPADVWCADVLTWDRLFAQEAFRALEMVQDVVRPATNGQDAIKLRTTRCPIRLDGELLLSERPAPRIGEHTVELRREFGLEEAG